MNILPEDYFRLKLSALKDIGLQWADRAKKVGVLSLFACVCYSKLAMAHNLAYLFSVQVAADSGALGLDGVYELIAEGESLPVCLKRELEVTNHIFLQLNMSATFLIVLYCFLNAVIKGSKYALLHLSKAL